MYFVRSSIECYVEFDFLGLLGDGVGEYVVEIDGG